MAMFLAGLRGIDGEMLKAAQTALDAGLTAGSSYRARPAFMSAFVVLAHMAPSPRPGHRAHAGGGLGTATEVPATFMYPTSFSRNQMGIGAASAVTAMMTIAAIIAPYLWSELRRK
ncbi:MAG: hypothetical protein R3D03_01285 [Geminicoccaceae bacterium]